MEFDCKRISYDKCNLNWYIYVQHTNCKTSIFEKKKQKMHWEVSGICLWKMAAQTAFAFLYFDVLSIDKANSFNHIYWCYIEKLHRKTVKKSWFLHCPKTPNDKYSAILQFLANLEPFFLKGWWIIIYISNKYLMIGIA